MVDCAPPVYLPASWKGVPFNVDSSSDEFGRRGDLYEYPLSDDTGFKDLGRRARRFKVEGYLIGSDQVELTNEMAAAAESPEPGTLDHPIYGSQMVSCVTLTTTADYRKDKKRTRLSFEFIEANPSMAPFQIGASISFLFSVGSDAVTASRSSAVWAPDSSDVAATDDISAALAQAVSPATDEASYDAIDMLARAHPSLPSYMTFLAPRLQSTTEVTIAEATVQPYITFASAVDPIDYGSATVRRIHTDALKRLRDFNAVVVNRSEQMSSASIQSLVITTRLILIRDFAVAVAQNSYDTVKAALDDLDFVMVVYDEEEQIATEHCDEVLASRIRSARAAAASAILSRNIRLPGVGQFPVDGLWPSLVVAHKLYADGTRYQQVENYNTTMPVFWMGRSVVAPAS